MSGVLKEGSETPGNSVRNCANSLSAVASDPRCGTVPHVWQRSIDVMSPASMKRLPARSTSNEWLRRKSAPSKC